MDDTFTLYNLKVEVVASDRPMVCGYKVGDYFLVIGEDIVFPANTSFSMYALSARIRWYPVIRARYVTALFTPPKPRNSRPNVCRHGAMLAPQLPISMGNIVLTPASSQIGISASI